jgi:hypothetical protein
VSRQIHAEEIGVIVGARPTGVEPAGAVCELVRDTLQRNFRPIVPREARVLPVESGLPLNEQGLEPRYRTIDTGLPVGLDDFVAFRWLHPLTDRTRG